MPKIISQLEKQIAAEVARISSTESGRNYTAAAMSTLPDEMLRISARAYGLDEENIDVYIDFLKGRRTTFHSELEKISGWFQTGDLILMTGSSKSSQSLVKAQKTIYSNARSSHVAIVYSDHICIDAMPKSGVQLRMLPEILRDCSDDWRIIRFHNLENSEISRLVSVGTFYLMQPYKIKPSSKSNKKYTYCSELARKMYVESGIKGTRIPDIKLITPSHFDRLGDQVDSWNDITDELRSAVKLVRRFEGFLSRQFEHFYRGIKLNRSRFDDRMIWRRDIRSAVKAGKLSESTGKKLIADINRLEDRMKNQFWDAQSSWKKQN